MSPASPSLSHRHQLFAIWSQFAIRPHHSVQCLTRDAEFSAQITDLRFALAHRRHGKAQLWSRHLELTPADTTAGARRDQTGMGALDNQIALIL